MRPRAGLPNATSSTISRRRRQLRHPRRRTPLLPSHRPLRRVLRLASPPAPSTSRSIGLPSSTAHGICSAHGRSHSPASRRLASTERPLFDGRPAGDRAKPKPPASNGCAAGPKNSPPTHDINSSTAFPDSSFARLLRSPRARDTPAADSASYLDNLALADRTLGEIREPCQLSNRA